MDPKLAELYGTTESFVADDTEKVAAAEFAEDLADEGSMDLDLSDEDLEAVAAEVLSETEYAEDESETEYAEDESEKTAAAEADQMGRVMAHAYVQELKLIEKNAGAVEKAKRVAQSAGRVLEQAGSKITPSKLSDKVYKSGKMSSMQKARKSGASIKDLQKGMTSHRSAGADRVGKVHKAVGGAAAAGAAGAVGFGAKKALEKKSSAIETLAEQRVAEILAANGYELTPETEKTAAPDAREVLASKVEELAWQKLSELGFEPSEE